MPGPDITRRVALGGVAASALAGAAPAPVLRRKVPSSGALTPAIGMGTWRTFDVGADVRLRAERTEVLRTFFSLGGELVDSSPMYGSSQEVVGAALADLDAYGRIFAADKVWTEGAEEGRRQIERSRRRWGVRSFDLLQVHNLVDWGAHLETLFAMKAQGQVRHVGVTSYAGLRYDEIARVMETEPIDFVQATYNILDREAEERLLPLAAEKGIAFIANRPFREGALLSRFAGRPLPALAADLGVANWAQYLLKFVISHPGVTVAIPATRRTDHMAQNMGAMTGPIPDEGMRREMARAVG